MAKNRDSAVLTKKLILRFGREMWFYRFEKGKWFCGYGGKCNFADLVKTWFPVLTKTKILRFWAKKDDFAVLADNMILFWWKIQFLVWAKKYQFCYFGGKLNLAVGGEGGVISGFGKKINFSVRAKIWFTVMTENWI